MKTVWCALAIACAIVLPADSGAATDVCRNGESITIAAEDGFFPYTGVYQGDLRGFSLDIVTAAFDAVGCRVDFAVMPYNRCTRAVQAGRQRGCFNTTGSADNRERYIFHDQPLFRGRIQIFSHPELARGFLPEDFHTKKFSVVRGYTYTDSFDSDKAINKVAVESDLQTLAMVARKRADFAVVYEKVAQYHISKNADMIDPAPLPVHNLVEFDLFVSFTRVDPAGSKALAAALDEGLQRIHDNGTYILIETSWEVWLADGVRKGRPVPQWIPAD